MYYVYMPPGGEKLKTAIMTIRLTPDLKAAAELAAKREHRSLTNLIEVLILNHCQALQIEPRPSANKESPQ